MSRTDLPAEFPTRGLGEGEAFERVAALVRDRRRRPVRRPPSLTWIRPRRRLNRLVS